MANAEEVLRIAGTLPGAVQEASPLEVSGKGFAWFYQEKVPGQQGRVEQRDVLVVRVAHLEDKEVLLAAEPEKFFTIPHYNGYPALHVRLPAITTDELTELLTAAWLTRAPRRRVAEYEALAASRR